MTIKSIKQIVHPIKEAEKTPTLFVSPDNLGMLMDALLVKKYRPITLNGAGSEYKNTLQQIIELYDSGKLYELPIALVRSKNVLSMEKDYKLDFSVTNYSIGKHTLDFGEHTLDGLKIYFNPKNLEQRIYSDCNSRE